MSYVLGFFAADGCMIKNNRGAHFIEFHITDKDLLEKIKIAMKSNHKISVRKRGDWKVSYRLQIGSKEMFKDLVSQGMIPRKTLDLKLPKVPNEVLCDFVRGYFDGDGNVFVIKRKDRKTGRLTIQTHFTCGNREFLKNLQERLKLVAGLRGGSLYSKENASRLKFSIYDSIKLYNFMYGKESDLFLSRKKEKFLRYINSLGP
ncbi:MAG: LAGLIDADG family homing endonuclease [Candidatus Moranbacteria bacterium]|nr:LAGLIDADG family homing endonuclease [Candidatus Moranbacteria bacterium]